MTTEYAVKLKAANGKTWWYSGTGGRTNRHRAMALAYHDKERAECSAAELQATNPGSRASVVKLGEWE